VIVADANVLVALLIPGPRMAEADILLAREPVWTAPFLCLSEFRNVLVGYVRRGEIPAARARALASAAEDLLRGREFRVASDQVLDRSEASGCTAYDCEYVVLAEQLGVPLVTSDKQVLRAFPEIAVSLEKAAGARRR
jgi:predicted nucleic acid-binding protein